MTKLAQAYQILGLEKTATSLEVKKAYRSLAKQWHPDLFFNQADLLQEAQQKIQQINLAYEIIKNQIPEEIRDRNTNSKRQSPTEKTTKVKTKNNTAELYYQRGVEFAEAEDLYQAISEFSQAIRLDSDYIKAYQYRGFIFSKLGYKLRADADFQRVAFLKSMQTSYSKEKVYRNQNQYSSNSNQNNQRKSNKNKQTNKSWRLQDTLLNHQREVSAIAFRKGDFTFVTASHDGKIKLWQTNTGEVITTLNDNSARINSLALGNNGKVVITGNRDRRIKIWNLEQRKYIKKLSQKFSRHFQEIIAIALDPVTNSLISASADNIIKIWNLDTVKKIKEIDFKSVEITCLAVNPRKGYFCSGGLEKRVRLRDIKTGKVVRTLAVNSGVLSLAFSPNGKLLATGQLNHQIQIWNVQTERKIRTFTGHQDRISALTFSADNRTLVSGSWDRTVKLWDLETGKMKTTFQGHHSIISSLAISSDGRTIVSGSRDHSIKIWKRNR